MWGLGLYHKLLKFYLELIANPRGNPIPMHKLGPLEARAQGKLGKN
jgi:hypothetical protein